MSLIPPDVQQCQAEITTYSPFIMGGDVRQIARCKNIPTCVATEKKASDGVKGSMSLCKECKAQLIKKMGKEFVTFERIAIQYSVGGRTMSKRLRRTGVKRVKR